ncbi:hypothetical protein BN874_420022 [Candidatus Contendobacter odensis Run_B_J11]|uniref:Uncharacterized protein n=1 Tax=Candidatus Contendobacter odensis Run_B_J11 TaxID=1400861 RepID=A0A7U7GDK1_9GAMM|nr:hypothetical protein BN874_420022 [Candidatus Contendobacter odensis Run_B_J11]
MSMRSPPKVWGGKGDRIQDRDEFAALQKFRLTPGIARCKILKPMLRCTITFEPMNQESM